MTDNNTDHQIPRPNPAVIDWLLEGDPAMCWQVLRDLTDASEAEVRAERAKVATQGWGAQLLAMQAEDGNWGGSEISLRKNAERERLL